MDVVCLNPVSGDEIFEGFCDVRDRPENRRSCIVRNCPGMS